MHMPQSLGSFLSEAGVKGGKKVPILQTKQPLSTADHMQGAKIRLSKEFSPLYSAKTGDEFLAGIERALSGLAAYQSPFTMSMAMNLVQLAKLQRSNSESKSRAKTFDRVVTFCMKLEQDLAGGRIRDNVIIHIEQEIKNLLND
jgi:hypothetical protein